MNDNYTPHQGATMYDTPITLANKYGIAGGSLAYVYGWLVDSSNTVLIGVIATVGGLAVSVTCQILRHKRESAAHKISMQHAKEEESRKKELHAALMALHKSKGPDKD